MTFNLITVLILLLISIISLYIAFYFFYKKIYLQYKNSVFNTTFEELIVILKMIINSEIESYENDVFTSKGSLTNSTFDNFYKDICNKVVRDLSPEMVNQLSKYISEEMIYRIIAKTVKKYLSEKI